MDNDYIDRLIEVFTRVNRQAPGSEETTRRAFDTLPRQVHDILDVGCGNGNVSLQLQELSGARVWSVDMLKPFLLQLKKHNTPGILPVCADMNNLPFAPKSFDLIWSEGSAYSMGYEKALESWKPLIRENGFLVVTELVRIVPELSREARNYWAREYPDMQTEKDRINQARECGYEILEHFTLPRSDWQAYYKPIEKVLPERIRSSGPHQAFTDLEEELQIFRRFGNEYSYTCLIMTAPMPGQAMAGRSGPG